MTRRARDPELARAESMAMVNIAKSVKCMGVPISIAKSATVSDGEENTVGDGAAVSNEMLEDHRTRSTRDEQAQQDPMTSFLLRSLGNKGSVDDVKIGHNSWETVAIAVAERNAKGANDHDDTAGSKNTEVSHIDATNQEVSAPITTAEEPATLMVEEAGHVPGPTTVETTIHTEQSAVSQPSDIKDTPTSQPTNKSITKPTSGVEEEPHKVCRNSGTPMVSSLNSTALEPEKYQLKEGGTNSHLLPPPTAGSNDAILSHRSRVRTVVFSRPHSSQPRRKKEPITGGGEGPGPGHYDVQVSGARKRAAVRTPSVAPKRCCYI